MLLLLPTFGFGQCSQVLPDTTAAFAENFFQDGFQLTFKGQPINQYSDRQGKVKFGIWYYFRPKGDVRSSGNFEFDVQQGWWNFYDRAGRLTRKIYYKHGQQLCIIDIVTGKQHSRTYKEHVIKGYKLADSQFW